MRPSFARRPLAKLTLLLCASTLAAVSVQAFPSYMGVYGSFQHQANGDPGVYTILMNQDYVGLHANVVMQINGAPWTEYAMTYSGNKDGNSVWTYSPTVYYPLGATIHYYFHGYEDFSNQQIYDSNNMANYTYTAQGASTTDITSNFDVHGNTFALGTESTDFSQFGLQMSFTDGNAASAVNFASNRFYNDWNWRHGADQGLQSGFLTMMKLDSLNRLTLYKPNTTNDQPVIVLDPGAGSITINGQPVGTSGSSGTGSNGGSSTFTTLAVGTGNSVGGQNAVAFGQGNNARGFAQTVLGEYNAGGTETSAQRVNTDPVFVIGNGTSASQASNAFMVNWNGDTTVSGKLSVNGVITAAPGGDIPMYTGNSK